MVGVSGGGKTTVTKLILRLYEIQSGIISQLSTKYFERYSTKFTSKYRIRSTRTSFVSSFIDSENIGYGKSGASKNEIIDAAKQAHAHEFITGLPDGYDTLVGERGVKLLRWPASKDCYR